MRAQSSESVRRALVAFIFIIAVFGPDTLHAQLPVPPPATVLAMTDVEALKREPTAKAADPVMAAGAKIADTSIGEPAAIRLFVGRSTVVRIGAPIQRISLTSAEIADAVVTSPSEMLLNGKAPGTISMFVWDRTG